MVPDPQTMATAIRIGEPKSWKKAVKALRFTSGLVMDVDDDEIMAAKMELGRDGIGSEPASATTLAGIRNLVADGTIGRDATRVQVALAGPGDRGGRRGARGQNVIDQQDAPSLDLPALSVGNAKRAGDIASPPRAALAALALGGAASDQGVGQEG